MDLTASEQTNGAKDDIKDLNNCHISTNLLSPEKNVQTPILWDSTSDEAIHLSDEPDRQLQNMISFTIQQSPLESKMFAQQSPVSSELLPSEDTIPPVTEQISEPQMSVSPGTSQIDFCESQRADSSPSREIFSATDPIMGEDYDQFRSEHRDFSWKTCSNRNSEVATSFHGETFELLSTNVAGKDHNALMNDDQIIEVPISKMASFTSVESSVEEEQSVETTCSLKNAFSFSEENSFFSRTKFPVGNTFPVEAISPTRTSEIGEIAPWEKASTSSEGELKIRSSIPSPRKSLKGSVLVKAVSPTKSISSMKVASIMKAGAPVKAAASMKFAFPSLEADSTTRSPKAATSSVKLASSVKVVSCAKSSKASSEQRKYSATFSADMKNNFTPTENNTPASLVHNMSLPSDSWGEGEAVSSEEGAEAMSEEEEEDSLETEPEIVTERDAGFKVNWLALRDAATDRLLWATDVDLACGDPEVRVVAKIPKEVLHLDAIYRELNFSTAESLEDFRVEQRVLFKGRCLEEWHFHLGPVEATSTQTWTSVFHSTPECQLMPFESLNGHLVLYTCFLDGADLLAVSTIEVVYV